MPIIKRKHSAAKERQNERQRRYFKDDLIQPIDKYGKPNREFIKRYGEEIYNRRNNAE